ncbi:MAG TPA: hypothetical protein VFE05_23770, partial [Longimicrobiaceae bacterium]|nr:hypothetical protein [Longimicrobiaceae bacterium]
MDAQALRILVVDTDAERGLATGALLAEVGMRCFAHADTYAAALASLRAGGFDALLARSRVDGRPATDLLAERGVA